MFFINWILHKRIINSKYKHENLLLSKNNKNNLEERTYIIIWILLSYGQAKYPTTTVLVVQGTGCLRDM